MSRITCRSSAALQPLHKSSYKLRACGFGLGFSEAHKSVSGMRATVDEQMKKRRLKKLKLYLKKMKKEQK